MIIVDIETSGLSPVKNGIWQIGALDFYHPDYEFLQEGRIDDEDIADPGALRVTGKKEVELRDPSKQNQRKLIGNFFDWCVGASTRNCVCENPQFDLGFLGVKAEKYGLKLPYAHRTFDLHSIAQFRHFQIFNDFLMKDRKSDLGLARILEFVGMEDKRIQMKAGEVEKEGTPHNALEDAELTAECFSRIIYGRGMFREYARYSVPDYLKPV